MAPIAMTGQGGRWPPFSLSKSLHVNGNALRCCNATSASRHSMTDCNAELDRDAATVRGVARALEHSSSSARRRS
jgi:hypothetical protein